MNRKTLPAVILLFCCASGFPQNEISTYYRKTTVDPIKDFFSSCDLRSATCVRRGECEIENISSNKCIDRTHVCCRRYGGMIFFPENTPRNTPPITTKKQTTRTTTPTTTTTTTEETPVDWLEPECGTQQSKGTGTTGLRNSNRGEFPWNVEIYYKHENDFGIVQNVFLCGGTLIDSFVVLTTANCLTKRHKSNLFVNAGVWNVSDVNEKRQVRKVKDIKRHPKFQMSNRVSSLALLVLDDQVDFSPTVNRICLPEDDTDFTDSTCFLTGWGGTGENPSETIRPTMKVVDMDLLGHKDCQRKIRLTKPTYVLRDSFQCANEESENHICPFDVGSPLICTIPGEEEQFYQAGIFVWNNYVTDIGNADCSSNKGVVNLFTNVKQFKNWIDTEMEKLDRNIDIYRPQKNDDNDEA